MKLSNTGMGYVAEVFASMTPVEIGLIITLLVCLAIIGIYKTSPNSRPNRHVRY